MALHPRPGRGEQAPSEARWMVVLVDGDQELMELLEEVVSAEGYRVARTTPPGLSTALLVDQSVSLVILDAELTDDPRQGAWATLRSLRDDPATSAIPVLVTSADNRALRQQAPEMDQLEGVTILGKPFSVDDLLEAMSVAIHDSTPGSVPDRSR